MVRNPWLWLIIIAIATACHQSKKVQRLTQGNIPTISFKTDSGENRSLTIADLVVDITIVGNIAIATFDITYYNPFDRVLEGEFDFPLADGQVISRYALDVNGKMREGVVVEKMTARVAFESTVRQGIDPGIAEKTKGNSFRTRIFPIPAKGNKRVIIATEQPLSYVNKQLYYQFPVYSDSAIDNFSIKATVLKSAMEPEMETNELAGFEFSKWNNSYTASYSKKNFIPNQTVSFFIPAAGDQKDLVFTEQFNNKTYFYINSPILAKYSEKKKPKLITLLWDISSSSEKRNITKELDIIKEYLDDLENVTVNFVPFNIRTEAVIPFTITDGNSGPLLDTLKNLYADGGTQLGAIDLNNYPCDEILLFTDGLSTFGKKEVVLSQTPVITINSNRVADYSVLKYIARQTNGLYIDLTTTETKTAVNQLTHRGEQFLKAAFDLQQIEEVYASGFAVAGILKTDAAEIKLNYGKGNEITSTHSITVKAGQANDYDNVKRIWASFKISELEMQYNKNKEEITRLGKGFSIVTQNTSFIVLDRLEDYVQHEIVPPAELQKEYFALLAEKKKNDSTEKGSGLTQALAAMEALKKWYHKSFDQSKPAKKRLATNTSTDTTYSVQGEMFVRGERVRRIVSGDTLFYSNAQSGLVYDNVDLDSLVIGNRLELSQGFSATISDSTAVVAHENAQVRHFTVPDYTSDPDGSRPIMRDSVGIVYDQAEPGITVKAWKPNADYLIILEQLPANKWLEKYRSLKKEYGHLPSFFVDISRFFLEKKNRELALLVLSNVNEMNLESPELLRTVANELLDRGETALAVETFKEIVSIREEHPQSYRDLALAEYEAGNSQEAIRLLYKIATGTWDERFTDIKSIALNEMNAIISAEQDKADISNIDKRLIYAMPMDVRIVVGWSTDNSDVDLWITDPYSEQCDYRNNMTRIGGKMSEDVTQGFGPEEFCLKKAVKGDYKVQVNLYGNRTTSVSGPIAVKAELFTAFGKPGQKRKTLNFRVAENKEVVEIGSLSFGN